MWYAWANYGIWIFEGVAAPLCASPSVHHRHHVDLHNTAVVNFRTKRRLQAHRLVTRLPESVHNCLKHPPSPANSNVVDTSSNSCTGLPRVLEQQTTQVLFYPSITRNFLFVVTNSNFRSSFSRNFLFSWWSVNRQATASIITHRRTPATRCHRRLTSPSRQSVLRTVPLCRQTGRQASAETADATRLSAPHSTQRRRTCWMQGCRIGF